MLRSRAAEPEVRSLMALLNRLYNGDGYSEDGDGLRWLVVDAKRIVDGVQSGRELNPGLPDDRAFILAALADSGRWSPSDPEPSDVLDAVEAALSVIVRD